MSAEKFFIANIMKADGTFEYESAADSVLKSSTH
jgi:hypothetical protein